MKWEAIILIIWNVLLVLAAVYLQGKPRSKKPFSTADTVASLISSAFFIWLLVRLG